jgi:hypothetical protein
MRAGAWVLATVGLGWLAGGCSAKPVPTAAELTREQAAALLEKGVFRKPPAPAVIRPDSGCSYGTYESVDKARNSPSASFLIGRKYGPEDKRDMDYYGWDQMGLVTVTTEAFTPVDEVPAECVAAKSEALAAGPPPGRSIPLVVKWQLKPSDKAMTLGFVAKPDGSAEGSLTELGPIEITGLLPRDAGTIVAEYRYAIVRSRIGTKAGVRTINPEGMVQFGGVGKVMLLRYDDGWRVSRDAVF